MIKKLLYLFFSVMIFVSIQACNSDKIWDFINPDIFMTVKDSSGGDLLDPQNEGNILGNGITVEYKGNIYPLVTDAAGGSKATHVEWQGLRTEWSEYFQSHVMLFGEFKGDGDFHREKFVINWGDGRTDTVEFDLYVTWNWLSGDPTSHHRIFLNGKQYSKESLRIDFVK